jgi:hypothetical protein
MRKSFPNHPIIQTILSKARPALRTFRSPAVAGVGVGDPVFIAISAIRKASAARNGTIIAQWRA